LICITAATANRFNARNQKGAPETRIVGTETVRITTLVEVHRGDSSVRFLKIDCQGFESEVLAGAMETLKTAKWVETEVSLAPLYKNAPTAFELVQLLKQHGFEIFTILPVFSDPKTSRLLQCDFLFKRVD
jgi:Methyltransferase FkbM domain